MASDLISREALLDSLEEAYKELKKIHDGLQYVDERRICGAQLSTFAEIVLRARKAPSVDAIPIDTVAEMLACLFGDECPCNYNDISMWLPLVCEEINTCPDVIGKHGCWKQFIKHWEERKKYYAVD